MTKREREVTDIEEILQMLDTCRIVHIGLCDQDQPYVIPLNYGYTYENGELTLYMHGALKGYKYDVIAKNPKASFAMECEVNAFPGKTACQYGTSYASVMGMGTISLVESPQEKAAALTVFMKTQTGKDFEFNERLVSIVNVMKFNVTEFSAKRRPLPEGMQQSSIMTAQ